MLLAVALRMSLTLHLLLFKQSMQVLIVIVLIYLILVKGKIYTNKSSQWDAWFVFCFLKIKLCAKMMKSLLLAL